MDRVIGVCGNCGGDVVAPDVWMGINPPPRRCRDCGSTVRREGPVLPMGPKPDPEKRRDVFVQRPSTTNEAGS